MLLLLILGLILIAIDIAAIVIIRRHREILNQSGRIKLLRKVAWVLGGCLGIAVCVLTWPYSATTRILGFPIPAAFLHLEGNAYRDYVSPFTPLIMALDFSIWLCLPQVFFAIFAVRRSKSKQIGYT